MYTALYRKKRPQTFQTMVDQTSIITTLRNQLRSGSISHAYLFCGTRGTGKTSTAKIFARAVNCPHSATKGDPCNECEICLDILAERNLNVIEIDAASNNGVDNIRDLREEVKYPPSVGTYKVYIIDEVHMLTTAAFNALLKTLEEPPEHIIFILATTDPQKIPATILSRCQRYDFKRISRQGMSQTLADYMAEEGIQIEAAAIEYIASVSDGAMRDALSILDQCLSLYENEVITLDKVQSLLGAVDQNALFDYTNALLQRNSAAALKIISKVSKEGRDLSRFTADIITHLRNILVAAQISNHEDILDYSAETISRFQAQGKLVPPEILIEYIKEFSELQNQLRYSSQERLILEVYTVKLSAKVSTYTQAVVSTDSVVEEIVASFTATQQSNSTTTEITSSSLSVPYIEPQTETDTNDGSDSSGSTNKLDIVASNWPNFCTSLGGLLKSMLALCKIECNNGITIICSNAGSLQYLKDRKNEILSAIVDYFQLPDEPPIVIIADEGYNEPKLETIKDDFKESLQSQVNMKITFE